MTKGLIWGWWDRLHAGMRAALRQALTTCAGDTLHVVLIYGRDLQDYATLEDRTMRREDLDRCLFDLQAEIGGTAATVEVHEYGTLYEATNDAVSLDFDAIFVVDHDAKRCFDYRSYLVNLNSRRRAEGKADMEIVGIATVFEDDGNQILSATKARRRALYVTEEQ